MKKHLTALIMALSLVLLSGGTSQAITIYGTVWEDATAQSMNPALGAPAAAATSTFTVSQINFDSQPYGSATYNQFLNNPVWTGTNIGSNQIDTSPGHGTFFQFTGYLSMVSGQNFTILHDDGFYLKIGNAVYDYSAPVSPTLATMSWAGATGIYAFTLNYGAYNGYPEVLFARGLEFTQAPEPASMLLLGLGLVGLAGFRKRMK